MISLRSFTLWAGWRKPDVRDIPSARPYEPPVIWDAYWRNLSAQLINAGLKPKNCDYSMVKWYTCDEIPVKVMNAARPLNGPTYNPKTYFAGVWLEKGNAIIFDKRYVNDKAIILHEMTHAMMQDGRHDAEHFNPLFGNFTGLQPEQLSKGD